MPETLWHLKKCRLFGSLLPEQLELIEANSRIRSFCSGEAVYLPCENADCVFLLMRGLVKVCHQIDDGRQAILAFVESGDLFGERAIFDDQERDEYVEAVEPTSAVIIPSGVMTALMDQENDFAIELIKMFGRRRHRIERRLRNLLFSSNHDRLVHLLIDLAEQFGVQDDDEISLRIKISHQELANLIGSTRETVTLLLGQLKAAGSVSGGRRKIVLTDPRRLCESVNRNLSLALPHPGHLQIR